MYSLLSRLDRRHRRLFQVANIALVLGLVPWVFREYFPVNHNWLDAWCGFFLGLSVTINLVCARAARRCPRTQA